MLMTSIYLPSFSRLFLSSVYSTGEIRTYLFSTVKEEASDWLTEFDSFSSMKDSSLKFSTSSMRCLADESEDSI